MSARILVIDDEESIRYTFESFLHKAGYKVRTAKGYDQFLEIIETEDFDLVITDIIIGGKSGIDILRLIKGRALTCPVIIITGYPTLEDVKVTSELGAFEFLDKPVDKNVLLNVVKKALHK